MLLLEIIEDILPIILLMVLGYFLREKKFIDDGLNKNLAFLVMNIALPSSIFVSVIKTLDLSQLGNLTVTSGEDVVAEIPLLAGEEVPRVTYRQMLLRLLKTAFLAG